MNFVIACVLIGLIPAAIAQSKGRSFVAWWLYGAALFIFALPHALMMGVRVGQGKQKCPHCAELVQIEAVVCRFCGRELHSATVILPGRHPETRVEPTPEIAEDFGAVTLPRVPISTARPDEPSRELTDVQDDMDGRGRARLLGVLAVFALVSIVWVAFSPKQNNEDRGGGTAALSSSTQSHWVVIAKGRTFFRTRPSAASGIAGEAFSGDTIDCDQGLGEWFRVTPRADSLERWVRKVDVRIGRRRP